MLVALASCTMPQGSVVQAPGLRAALLPATEAGVVSDGPVKIGAPYMAGGLTYHPADTPDYDEVGYASWYGEELSGNSTANGEAFNPAGISAAHCTLPMPSYVEVTALATGRTILVRVNDRGPFDSGRLIDLSRGAAEQLGIAGHGAAPVRVRRVNPPEPERIRLRSGQQAASRMEAPENLLAALRAKLPKARPGGPRLDYDLPSDREDADVTGALQAMRPPAHGYFVQLAAFSSRERAAGAARRADAFLSRHNDIWRVLTGPYKDAATARRGVEHAAASGFNGARIVVNE